MTAAQRRSGRFLVAAVTYLALCGLVVSLPTARATSPRAASGHFATHTRLTAKFIAGTGSATCDPTASLRPAGSPVVSAGSYMATIKKRGYLIAGVDQNTYHFGYRNPLDGQIEGFDIDMLHAIAAAIFGNPNQIRYVAVSDAQRIPAIRSGEVDIVAHTMTITCDRLKLVDFSTVYFDAVQRILVDRDSPVTQLSDLAGGKVCATTSSTSLTLLEHYADLTPVPVTYWTDCLVLLQENKVDAISTDNAILAGLQAQDPETKVVGPPLEAEPYGLAISLQHPDFVRFVNAALAKMRADGQWAVIYKKWLGAPVPPPPAARYRG